MKGRTEEELPDPARDMADAQASRPASHESLRGGKHEAVQERSLMEQVLAPENLNLAWKRVKANKGAPGIDKMAIGEFPAFLRANWTRLRFMLIEGTYSPAPVLRVLIPKPDGSERPLGIPTVLDRVIQQALAQVLGPLFEGDFSEHSYGFGPLSPLLANIVLDPLDKELERRGHRFARYADDFLVLVKSAKAAGRVKQSLTRFIEEKLKLVVNRTKSQSAPLRQCSFLGFCLGGRGQIKWTDKALKRFKLRVKEITSRNRGRNVDDVILELHRYVTGWLNYFGISRTFKEVVVLDSWIRRRVRLYYWKQWKQPRTRRRRLIALGIPPEETKLATRSRKGYWRMSENSILHRALNNAWLAKQGVPDFRKQWIVLHYGPKVRV